MSMLLLFAINVSLAFFWVILMQSANIVDFVVGFVIGLAILTLVEPQYTIRGGRIPLFLFYVLWQVIVSSLVVAGYILRPHPDLSQGIIAIPLDVTTPFEIAALASVITLTPGTLSVDVSEEKKTGQRVLFVHALSIDSPDKLVHQIKNGFERQILRISKGAA